MAHNAVADLLRSWLDVAGCTVGMLIGRFTPEHFGDATPPGRSATYDRLAGKGLTWEFIEAVVDVTTGSADLQEQRLAEVRVHWDLACQSGIARTSRADIDLAHRALDLAERLRKAEHRVVQMVSERDRIREVARAMMIICERIRERVEDLHRDQALGRIADGDPTVSGWELRLEEGDWQRARAEDERERVQIMLLAWSRHVADLSRSLLPGSRYALPHSATGDPGLVGALDLHDGDLDNVDRMLSLTGQAVAESSDLLNTFAAELGRRNGAPEPFLQFVRLGGGPAAGFPSLPITRQLERGLSLRSGITVLAGPNGSGKSTVLAALARLAGCQVLAGRDPNEFSGALDRWLEARWSPARTPESCEFRAQMADGPKGVGPLTKEIDGARNRLFLLDEPEASLHPKATARLVERMVDRVAHGCQFVITTHSMTLASIPQAQVVTFRRPPEGRVRG
ncbi:AAA family ATPase [Kitasatospora sp. NPDC058965]|uniref:AAA family ATPase n=1 Tax=Kitasatospora sp. NPDC058965 TaxID=3346682 RepID=UPI0036B95B30